MLALRRAPGALRAPTTLWRHLSSTPRAGARLAPPKPADESAPSLWHQAMGPIARVTVYASGMYLTLHAAWNALDLQAEDVFRQEELQAKQGSVREAVLAAQAHADQQEQDRQTQASKSWIRRTLHL